MNRVKQKLEFCGCTITNNQLNDLIHIQSNITNQNLNRLLHKYSYKTINRFDVSIYQVLNALKKKLTGNSTGR